MDTDIFLLNQTFGFKTAMTKAERLDYKHSMLTHAMVLTGVNVANGEVNRWKVENSWGEKLEIMGILLLVMLGWMSLHSK